MTNSCLFHLKTNTTTIFLAAIATALPVAVFAQPSNTSTQTMGDNSITDNIFTQTNTANADPTESQTITGATGNNSPTTGTQSQTIDQTLTSVMTATFTINPSPTTTQSITPPTP